MAITIFKGLCMLGEAFLVYVLYYFIQEGRRGQARRRLSALYRYTPAVDAGTRVTRRRVIQITIPQGYKTDAGIGRRAS